MTMEKALNREVLHDLVAAFVDALDEVEDEYDVPDGMMVDDDGNLIPVGGLQHQAFISRHTPDVMKDTGMDTIERLNTLAPDVLAHTVDRLWKMDEPDDRGRAAAVRKATLMAQAVADRRGLVKSIEDPTSLDGQVAAVRRAYHRATREMDVLTMVEIVYADRLLVWMDHDYYTIPYEYGDDGTVDFGQPTEVVVSVETSEVTKHAGADGRCPACAGWHTVEKRTFTTAQRKALAKSGAAIPVRNADGDIVDGRFPIETRADLRNALQAFGRVNSSDRDEVRRHIRKRARALDAEDLIENSAVFKASLLDRLVEKMAVALGFDDDVDPDALPLAKQVDEKQFTLAPLYIPNRLDAHQEWAEADDNQQALWSLIRKDDRRIRRQHNPEVVAGEVVEAFTEWEERTATMMVPDVKKAGEFVRKQVTFPPGTTFLGVVWTDGAWDDVKKGRLRGLSMGGTAHRIEADLGD